MEKMPWRRTLVIDVLVVALACALFSFWFFDGLDRQGVYCDVAIFGNAALSAIKNAYFFTEADNLSMNILGRKIPLMVNQYNAGTDIYAALPWVGLLGHTPRAMHMPGYVWGIASLLCLYPLALGMSGSRLFASLVCLMVATSPAFIAASRIGSFAATVTIVFALLSLLAWLRWKETHKTPWLFLMGLSLGIGLAGRIQFLWFINAFWIYLFLTRRSGAQHATAKGYAAATGGFVLGALSFVLGNLKSDFLTFRFVGHYALVSREGVSNLSYLHNLSERFGESLSLLNGAALSPEVHPPSVGIYLFILGLVFIGIRVVSGRLHTLPDNGTLFLMPLSLYVLALVQSPITPTLLHVHHIIFLLPLLCMVCCIPCLGIRFPLQKGAGFTLRFLETMLGLAALLLAAASLFANYQMLQVQQAHRNIHSGQELKWDVMSEVEGFLESRGIKRVGLGDTGLYDPLVFLSGFGIDAEEVFYARYKDTPLDVEERNLRKRLRSEAEGYYLFRPEDRAWVRFFPEFQKAAADCGKRVDLLREFKTPEGVAVYRVFRVY